MVVTFYSCFPLVLLPVFSFLTYRILLKKVKLCGYLSCLMYGNGIIFHGES